MLLHQGLAGCANWVKDIDIEIERNDTEKSARHHHQSMLGMWGGGQYRGRVNQERYTHANLANGDIRGSASELSCFRRHDRFRAKDRDRDGFLFSLIKRVEKRGKNARGRSSCWVLYKSPLKINQLVSSAYKSVGHMSLSSPCNVRYQVMVYICKSVRDYPASRTPTVDHEDVTS